MDLKASQDILFTLKAKKGSLSYKKKHDIYAFNLKKVAQITWFSAIDFQAGTLSRKNFVGSWSRLVGKAGLSFLLESGRKEAGKPSTEFVKLYSPRRKAKGLEFSASFASAASLKQVNNGVKSLESVSNPRLQFAGTLSKLVYRRNLKSRNFKGKDMRGSEWTGVTFQNSNFQKSKLNRIDAVSADFSRSNFNSASMNRMDLTGSDLSKSSFSDASITDALLDGVNAVKSDFSYANIARSNFIGADLNDSNFTAANMTEVKAIGANFAGADLRGADLTGADVRFANFINANLNNTTFASVDFEGASFGGATFVGATCFDENKLVSQPCLF